MIRKLVNERFADAGITVGGSDPWDIRIKHDRFYRRVAFFHSLGLGDSYRDGDFECAQLEEFLYKLMKHRQEHQSGSRGGFPSSLPQAWVHLQLLLINQQTAARAAKAISHHYDIGNELYEPMLGDTMAYSCGYWAGANNLDEAQRNKYRIICEKIGLREGMRVLEIGCGWGGFAAFAAKEYGARVAGISLSGEQVNYARTKYRSLHDDGMIHLQLMDYRDIPKCFPYQFDAIVSIGMFEHVGPDNYDEYMRTAWLALKHGRPFLLHTIIGSSGKIDPFIWYRIFPGGILPMEEQIARSSKPYFVLEHLENFGFDYALTLDAWWRNFETAWPELKKNGHYNEKFRRVWEFYLKSCAAMFRVRRVQLQQWMLVKGGTKGGFQWNRPQYHR